MTKYSPTKRAIAVRVARADPPASAGTITVTDRGIGIPTADLLHIFERFRRAGNVIGKVPGSGIGLASAQQIVAQHGGTITVTSVEERGSSFTVRLPLG